MNTVKWVSKIRLAGLLAMGVLIVTLTGCLNDDDNPTVPVALVSMYHGSPDAPDLDIEVDNRQINFYPFEYADFTGYLRFYTGQRNLKFGPYAASNIVIDTTVTFERDQAYSVFVVEAYEDASIVVLHDNSAPPSSGKAKVRVINIAPDAPAIDFAEQDGADALVEGLSFKEASDFIEVDADEFDFQVRTSTGIEVLLQLPDINFQPRYYYTVIVRGYLSPPSGNTNVLSAQIVVN
jgi:hypothetical protein